MSQFYLLEILDAKPTLFTSFTIFVFNVYLLLGLVDMKKSEKHTSPIMQDIVHRSPLIQTQDRPCLLKMSAVLQIAPLNQMFMCAVDVYFGYSSM